MGNSIKQVHRVRLRAQRSDRAGWINHGPEYVTRERFRRRRARDVKAALDLGVSDHFAATVIPAYLQGRC